MNCNAVHLDLTTFNAARIWKLYGTFAHKGDSLPDRPHRRSAILEVPDLVRVVPRETLGGLAALVPRLPAPEPSRNGHGGGFDLGGWIADHNLPVVSAGTWQGGRKWILNPCPWDPAHNNRAAFILQHANGAVATGCHHNGCHGKGWPELRVLYEPDYRRNGHDKPGDGAASNLQPNLPPIGGCVGSEVGREVSAADLKSRPHQEVEYLPFLGKAGYMPRGWSVLIAASPKCGKTELTTRLCQSWEQECILYVTEEPESIWTHRLAGLPSDWSHVRVLFGLGMEPGDILARIRAGGESVVVLDTARSLLGLEDENDNSELARVLRPFVVAAREGAKTLVVLHHLRKGGGNHGEGISGGHAFLAAVDVALELLREPNVGENKRRVRGWGRLFPIEEAVYELNPDGSMSILGSPKAVELDAVKERVRELLNGDWQTQKEVLGELSEPKPGPEQVRLALKGLVADGMAERDPKADKQGTTYRYRLAQPAAQPHFPRTPSMVGSDVGAEPAGADGLELYAGDVPPDEELAP